MPSLQEMEGCKDGKTLSQVKGGYQVAAPGAVAAALN
jgi:hypothetical protein